MLESLKDSKHNTTFPAHGFLGIVGRDLLLKTISAADQDFNYTPELLVFKFLCNLSHRQFCGFIMTITKR